VRKLIVSIVVVGAGLSAMGSVAGAGEPAKRGCVGESISANARADVPYGAFLAGITPRNEFGTVADGLHFVQAGVAPDEIYPNTCN
jgi:hypothetical protein